MLGKLLKYDFRSMLKQFAFVWPAALVLALVNRFLLVLNIEDASQLGATVNVVTIMVYVAILIAMFVLSVVFVIQRFYKGLLGDEGYLMHTLPVRPWQLISSKLICAVVVTLVSILVAMASFLILMPMDRLEWAQVWNSFSRLLVWKNLSAWVELLIVILVGTAQGYLMLYLAMAIGHLFNKHRVVWSFVTYIAINSVQQFLVGMFGLNTLTHIGLTDSLHPILWASIAAEALLAAVYFFATSYILKNKLNLE